MNVLLVDHSTTEHRLAARLASHHRLHLIDRALSRTEAIDKLTDPTATRYDCLIIGCLSEAHGMGCQKDMRTAHVMALEAQNNGIRAATVHYYDWSKPLHNQFCFLRVYDPLRKTIQVVKFQYGEEVYLTFDLNHKPIRRDAIESVLAHLEELEEKKRTNQPLPREISCRNWPLIFRKAGIPMPPTVQPVPTHAKKPKFVSLTLERRLKLGSTPKRKSPRKG